MDLSSAQADFLFVLDQSGSVKNEGLRDEFQFVLFFLNRPFNLRVGAEKSAIAVATFSDDFILRLTFEEALNSSQTAIT